MARKRENSTEKQTAFPPTKYVVKMAFFFFFFCIEGYFKTCPGPKVGFIANMRWKKYICIYIYILGCVSLAAQRQPTLQMGGGNPPCSLLAFINIIDDEFVDRINLVHSRAVLTEPRCNENLLASGLKHGCLRQSINSLLENTKAGF